MEKLQPNFCFSLEFAKVLLLLCEKCIHDINPFAKLRLIMINFSVFPRPAEELEFKPNDSGTDIYDMISLKNTLPYSIAFKVCFLHLQVIIIWCY